MAKGISTILATVMLLLITISMVAVFYVFGTGLITTSTGATTITATTTTEMMLKVVAIPVAKCSNTTPTNNIINFTLQNVGTKDILGGELKVYVDDVQNTNTAPNLANTGLNVGEQIQIGVTETSYKKIRNLKVQGPSNTVMQILNC